jgi:hypothetical protein
MYNIAAFYHVAAMGNWKDVVTEQLNLLSGADSGATPILGCARLSPLG